MKKEQLPLIKVLDKIKIFEKKQEITHTNFLDPAEQIEIQNVIRKVPHTLVGGYIEAERKVLVIGLVEEETKPYDFLKVIRIEANKNLSHRDILGSLLGLGIKREMIGDILINANLADIIVLKEISSYVLQNLNKIGKEKVKAYEHKLEELLQIENTKKEIKTTVASLRVDAIVSCGIGVSREISSKLIQTQKVKLNHKLLENASKKISEGDILSIRGYGRLELVSILGETRKDRIRIILKRYWNQEAFN